MKHTINITQLMFNLVLLLGLVFILQVPAYADDARRMYDQNPNSKPYENSLRKAQPVESSVFCDVCKIQGCECKGGKCVNCSPTKLTSPSKGD